MHRKAESIVTSLEAELSWYGQIVGFAPPGVPPGSGERSRGKCHGPFGIKMGYA